MEDREEKIEHAILMLCDLVPYDDPDYENKVRKMAEDYVDNEDKVMADYAEYCKTHKEWLNEAISKQDELPF